MRRLLLLLLSLNLLLLLLLLLEILLLLLSRDIGTTKGDLTGGQSKRHLFLSKKNWVAERGNVGGGERKSVFKLRIEPLYTPAHSNSALDLQLSYVKGPLFSVITISTEPIVVDDAGQHSLPVQCSAHRSSQ